ncbi:hypothetical protein HDU99_009317, partial [Rhizoclosmatium hyalinum]
PDHFNADEETGNSVSRNVSIKTTDTEPDHFISKDPLPNPLDSFPTSKVHHSAGDSKEAFHARKQLFGTNVLPEAPKHSLWDFAKEALKDKTLIILMIAAGTDVAIGIYKTVTPPGDPLGFVDGLAIIIAVVVIVLIQAVNDYRKQAQFHQLSDFSKDLSRVQVLREGANIQIKTTELLVGDICHIQAGDLIPADGLVIQGFNLSADESSMTGESVALNKDTVNDPFLFSGTKLTNGVGRMVVVATGRQSMNGRLLAALDAEEPEDTPLQVKLGGLADLIAKWGGYIAIGMFVTLVIVYVINHHNGQSSTVTIVNDVINLVIIAITLVVVAVPEGLPLAVTISLAYATLQMLKDQNLVRHLKACETMGNATTICSDKTGTLTQNKMQVVVGVVACHTFGSENLSTNSKHEANLMKVFTDVKSTSVLRSNTTLSVDSQPVSRVNTYASQSGLLATADDSDAVSRSNTIKSETGTIFRKNVFGDIPDVVVDFIARSINLNSTAEEVVTDAEEAAKLAKAAAATKALQEQSSRRRGRSPFRKATGAANHSPDAEADKPAAEFVGSKTEIALLEFTRGKLGKEYVDDRKNTDVVEVIPFSSDRKRMSTIIKIQRQDRNGKLEGALFGDREVIKKWLFCKGAAEIVVKLCDRYVNSEGRVVPITDEVRKEYESAIDTMAACALRTICMAFKPVVGSQSGENTDDENLILAGIVGIRDPIRPEVPGAVADCKRAGVVVRMVTGDNTTTARSIAINAGILPESDEGFDPEAVMDGPTFRKLTPEMMDRILPKLRVLARSSPLDKQILVQNLKRLGETVAVTGDGTNDAPALKSADVGFSMGIAGTEMAKEASDIILLDDNFASLSKAIIWGRSVYDSVRKFLQFQLTVNIVAVVLTVVSSFMTAVASETKTPLSALTAVQLLWVNLIMDTFAALALATDPPTPELLNRPPARKSDPLINYDMWKMISVQSVYQIVVCAALYCTQVVWTSDGMDVIVGTNSDEYTESYERMGTLVFNTFVFCQLFNELNCRVIGRELNIFKNIQKNPMFIAIVGGSVIVQVIIVEFGSRAFKTVSLNGADWALCLGLAAFSIPLGVLVRVSPDLFKKKAE